MHVFLVSLLEVGSWITGAVSKTVQVMDYILLVFSGEAVQITTLQVGEL